MSKIIITGGAGFIGSHLADKLIEQGEQIVIVDNLYSGRLSYINPKAKFYLADIRDEVIDKIFEIEKPDIVYHLAAQMSVPFSVENPIFDMDINIRGLLNILQASVKHEVKKFVFSSSGGAIYGESEEYPTTENTQPEPFSPYAIAKYTSEHYLSFYKKQHGLDYVVTRFANVYGPRQVSAHESGVVTIFVQHVLSGKPVKIYSYPHQTGGMYRDYVYVADVVSALAKAKDYQGTDIFNVGTGVPSSTLELFDMVKEISGLSVEHSFGPPRQGDLTRNCLNIDKSKSILGWSPEYDLRKGLELTLDYFKKL
jgi:UDP-glucose 4-epimerase